MKLTLRSEYALRALAVLGMSYEQPVVPIETISSQQHIPKRFLEQILNDLKNAGIVESRRGTNGGYRLAKPPEQISLASVIRHLDGALAPVRCVSENFYQQCSCPDEARCGIRSIMKEVRDAIVKTMDNITVADLCARYRKLQGDLNNPTDYVI
ncbi:MAG: Rrf2 family transcriptional regulator [Verrucomicrobiota bacterium]